eukprot:TRINITY_DN6348_c0_g1_i1.p1 TRINITY_DN6348_c0_g1~~TRINITY_DN6348_c0_g1_i1.p1  ORF type:complete len:284 (-),score=38.41 TRINITY_DN6348_c0_g1_i1:2-853(-)
MLLARVFRRNQVILSTSTRRQCRYTSTNVDSAGSYKSYNSYQELVSGNLGLLDFPVTGVQFLLEGVHHLTASPWWVTIAASSILLRVALFPIQIKQYQTSLKLVKVNPEITQLSAKFKQELTELQSAPPEIKIQKQKEVQTQLMEIYAKYDVTPFAPFKYALVQAPFFILFFLGLQSMAKKPAFHDALANGGFMWFNDLTVLDPYYILPAMSGLLISLPMIYQQRNSGAKLAPVARYLPYFMGGLIFLIGASFPSALNVYFATSGLFSCVSMFVLKSFKNKLN